MKFIKLLLLFIIITACAFDSEEESPGGGLFAGHQSVENIFSISLPNNGTYRQSENLDFVVTHPLSVTVTGTPQLDITVGENSYTANYVSGSGSKNLIFRYSVQAGDEDFNGIVVSATIQLNSGALDISVNGVIQSATPTIDSIPTNEILVDTGVPSIILVTPPIPDTYRLNEFMSFVVAFDDLVLISGTPRIQLDIGGVTRYASYTVGTGTSTALFSYQVQAADIDSNGIVMVSPLQLSGGSITDFAGNNATLTYTLPPTNFVNVDGDAPYITAVTPPANATYFNGQTISFSLVFNESVDVAGGTPSVDITVGSTTRSAAYTGGTGTTTLAFSYTVSNTDLDNNGIVISNLITLNGSTIKNSTPTDALLEIASPLTPNVKVYGIIPEVVSITPPVDNDYITGSTIDFIVLYNESVNITNTPRLNLDVGGATRYANYLTGTGTDTLMFRYTVQVGDIDNNGILLGATSIDLNTTGTINSTYSSSNADLDYTGLEPTMTGVTVNQAPATKLVITQEPTDQYVNTDIAPAITVEIRDAGDNLVTSAVDNVTIAIGTDPIGGSVVSGTLTVAAVGGIATFSDIEIDTIGNGFTLTVTSGSLTLDTSATFNIVANNATKLAFSVEPTDALAGVDISAAIKVEIRDAGDSLVTAATNNITLSFDTDPSAGQGTLAGTLTVAAVAGVATFSDIDIDKAFPGYILKAASGILTDATSSAFQINPNVKNKLGFSVEPSDAEVSVNISPAIKVEIQDTYGNKTADTDTITIAFNNDPSAGGATLAGTLGVAAVAGVATFSDINVDVVNTGYTLDATAGGVTTATSTGFDITTTPTKLTITQEPTNTYKLFAISPALTVEIRDAGDNLVTSATSNVTVALGTDPSAGGATLGGTLTVAAVGGVATFSDLTLDDIQNAYDLTFTSAGLTADTSDPFNITQAPATKVAFVVQPSNTVAGVNIAASITVEIRDAIDNVVTGATDNVTITFQNDASTGAATLSGTLTKAAVAGVATFSDINIDKAFTGYTFLASSGGLTTNVSSAFNITHAAATKLGFNIEPVDTNDSTVISPDIEVSVLDTYDNIVLSATDNLTIAFQNDASVGAGTLSGTLVKAAVAGVASFDNISIDYPATGYTLSGTGGGYTAATSAAFTIFGTPIKLGYSIQPADTQLGNNLPNIIVNILDAADNIVGSATNSVTLALSNDPSAGSATFSGTKIMASIAGVATFTALSIDEAHADFTIIATSGALTSIISNPFDITLPPPTSLTLVTPASSPDSDTTPKIQVGGVASGDVVKLYTDSGCTTEIASFTSSGTTVDITTSVLAEGVYTIYAKRTSSGGTPSVCSTANVAYEVQGSFYQLDQIANNNFGNWVNAAGDDGDWSTDTNDTQSTDVGPTGPQAGTHYAFTEASNPAAVNDEFILESNTLDGSANDLAFSFYWNKRGDNMGDLYFEASNNGGSTWATLWSHTGSDVGTGGADVWRNQFVDVCDGGYTSNNVKLRLRAVMPASGDVWNSDIGIDELEVNSGGCAPGTPATITMDTPIDGTVIGVLNMNAFTVAGTCSDNGQNVTLSGDVSGSTTCAAGAYSIILDLSAHADGDVTITADHTSSTGGANGTVEKTLTKDSLNIQFDNLDTLGNWSNVAYDDHDWILNTGDTPSNGVGPSNGEGGSGSYAFTEASSPVTYSEEFVLESNSLAAGTYNLNFSFYYNKRGDSMGDIYVEVSTNAGSTWDAAVWSHTGVDVGKNGTDIWRQQSVDLCNAGYTSGNVLVRIRTVMPAAGTVWNSDIGIDSLKFTNDGCP